MSKLTEVGNTEEKGRVGDGKQTRPRGTSASNTPREPTDLGDGLIAEEKYAPPLDRAHYAITPRLPTGLAEDRDVVGPANEEVKDGRYQEGTESESNEEGYDTNSRT